jgi:ABC-type enterochelin transport system permease subunit
MLYLAPAAGRSAMVGPIAASGAVVPVIVGLIEGDTLRPATAAGMVLAGVGTVCSSWNLRRAGVRRWPSTAAS